MWCVGGGARTNRESLLQPSPSCFAIHLSQSERLVFKAPTLGSEAKPRVLEND